MSKYLSADFDRERGDALTITREEAVAFREVGNEIGAPILWALVAEWFAGNPGDPIPKMKDPRDQRDLARLIEHQKANVSRCVVNAAKKQENARERWGRPPEEQPSEDMQMHTKKCKCIKGDANADKYSKDKDKISSSDKLESLSMSIKNVGPSGVANVAPPGGGTFARTATDNNGRTYREADFAIDPVGKILAYALEREEDNLAAKDLNKDIDKFRGALKKRARLLASIPGAFVSVCFDIVSECCEALRIEYAPENWDGCEGSITEVGKDAGEKEMITYGENIRRTIIGRLNRVIEAHGLATR